MTQKYTNRNIRDFVRQLVDPKARETPSFAFCSVKSVDKANKTIDCESINEDKTEFINVMLSTEANDSFSVYPAIDSTVLILFTSFFKLVILIEEVESLICDIDKNHLEMDKDKFVINNNDTVIQLDKEGDMLLNDGSKDGLVVVADLVTKLNKLENTINSLITSCQSVIVTLAPSGTFPLVSFFTGNTPIAPLTQKADLENTKIKHGI